MEHAETVVEYTITELREAIREGRFAPGQRLVVADVTRSFGVSAGPVREAIRRLTGEGLIDIVPHRGATVRTFSLQEVRDIFDLREVIEGMTARAAARRIDQDDNRERLEACRDAMEAAVDKPHEYVSGNQAFHELLYRIAGNGKAVEIATQLTLPIYRMQFHRMMDPDYTRTSMDEHDTVIAAVLAGDEEAAEREMRRHIRHSGDAMVAALENAAIKARAG